MSDMSSAEAAMSVVRRLRRIGIGAAGEEEARVRLVGVEERLALVHEHLAHPLAGAPHGGAVGARRDDGDPVAASGELRRQLRDVAVDLAGTRPGERGRKSYAVAGLAHGTSRAAAL